MVICGSIKGFTQKEVDTYGFPLDGIQVCLRKDIISEEFVFSAGTDLFLDIFSAEYSLHSDVLSFKCKCESLMVDGEETDLEINGDLVYSLIRGCKVTELILSGDYSDFAYTKKSVKLKDIKTIGSLMFNVGNHCIYKKGNKVKFY